MKLAQPLCCWLLWDQVAAELQREPYIAAVVDSREWKFYKDSRVAPLLVSRMYRSRFYWSGQICHNSGGRQIIGG